MPKLSLYGAGQGFGFQMRGIQAGIRDLVEQTAKRGADIARGFFDTNGPNGSWQPLHEFTRGKKGSTRILVETGDLQNSIRAVQVGPNYWAVIASDSKAPIHEFGASISVTKESRGWLAARGFHVKESTTKLIIPARPFMRPAADQLEKEMSSKSIGENMGGMLTSIGGVGRIL